MAEPPKDDMLTRLQQAQERVEALKASGAEFDSPEAKRAVNSLITQIRHATPQDLQAFDAWKQEKGYK